ncbi:hypothetical protein SDC9_171402 [bioreactor metagenome]|uniref:Uncharacterized protein n=1 Tax=bioreactor metagenome TaxID=1076179 RepID=A0A645GE09_9ZZZZ
MLKSIIASNLLDNALSNALYKLVVAIKTILSFKLSRPFNTDEVALPISLKSLELILSMAIASISSNRIMTFCGFVTEEISSNKADIFLDV